ncbi:hypothetical protein [Desulfoluna spongiiphila]|uniref:hypothetical protein n=1 Tax=Desulfoluna spongiiphila TaxID=419481 RepID=UPI00125F7C5C|nr:hypothetical protein [Desulfoluna spongiiphila]
MGKGAEKNKNKKKASGGKVSHLESKLRMRFAPRFSGQITSAFNEKIYPKRFFKTWLFNPSL